MYLTILYMVEWFLITEYLNINVVTKERRVLQRQSVQGKCAYDSTGAKSVKTGENTASARSALFCSNK